MPRSTATLTDGDLICVCHQILTYHFPGIVPALQRMQGSLIDTHIGEVVVAQVRERSESKGVLISWGET